MQWTSTLPKPACIPTVFIPAQPIFIDGQKKLAKTFRLAGQFRDKKGWPKEGNAWHCANAGEAAWNNYRFQFLNTELEKFGYIEFAMAGNPRAVRIGSGFMEFVLKDNTSAAGCCC